MSDPEGNAINKASRSLTSEGGHPSEHPFFADLQPAHREALAACARSVRFPPGAYVLQMNAPADTLYLIDRGRVVLEVGEPGRGPTQVEEVRAGDVLGLSWLFPPFRWHLDARAVEEVTATALAGEEVRRLMDADAQLGRALAMRLLATVYQRLERTRLQRLDVYRGRA
jgi:CRP-like cAMP-binding protein